MATAKDASAASREVLDFRPGAPMTWEIVCTARDSGGARVETINSVAPHVGGPPLHVHPTAEESYEVIQGTMDVFVHGEWRKLGPGERAVVPPGVAHTVKNDSDHASKVVNVHSPALDFESFFRELHRLVSTGAAKFPPKDPRSLIKVAMLFSAYPQEQRVVRPPHSVFSALAFLGRRLGYRLDG